MYVLHFARPGDIIAGSHFGVLSAEDDVEAADREEVQRLVARQARRAWLNKQRKERSERCSFI